MSLFTRISTSLRANIEQMVDQIENQDALIEAAISEMKQANGRARARLGRVERDRQALQQQRDTLQQATQQWQQRALRSAADEATALACLQRHNQCDQQLRQLEQNLAQQQAEEARLRARLEHNQRRIAELSQRRHLLRTRESSLQAEQLIGQWQSGPLDVEAVFERWEGRLLQTEPLAHACSALDPPTDALADSLADPLARRFQQEEQDSALRLQLQALIAKEQDHV